MGKRIKRRKNLKKSLLVVKEKSGESIHVFDAEDLMGIMTSEDRLKIIEEQILRNQAQKIYDFLLTCNVKSTWVQALSSRYFFAVRGVWGDDPLDMIGTASSGGRLNVGGAQVSYAYNTLCARASSGLYMSDSKETVFAEMALPSAASAPGLKRPNLFELSYIDTTKELRLFDLDTVIDELDSLFPAGFSLKALAIASPLSAEWKLQKTPAPIQLIAQWLRASNLADGIKARSARRSEGFNYFLFFDSSNETAKNLKYILFE